MSGRLLAVENLHAGYEPGVAIVRGASIDVAACEIVTLLGPNGAGKSTLIKAIVGLVPKFEGSVVLAGRDITQSKPHELVRSGLGFVPQTENVFTRMSIEDNLALAADILPVITKVHVRTIIDRSLKRLGMDRLDLVQFHWWDYEIPGCIETALWLKELKEEGKIDRLGGTNFDTAHTRALIAAGMDLVGMQVQYSLLDARPENGLVDLCRANHVYLLCYGSVAGGFLSDHWIGKPEPRPSFENRSLVKYKLIIDDFGGWELLQDLLHTLRSIADRHGVDIATVASRAILERPQVAAVIIGARSDTHLAANLKVVDIALSAADHDEIADVLAQRRGPSGDTFSLERDRQGRHGAIMKYNLSRQAS